MKRLNPADIVAKEQRSLVTAGGALQPNTLDTYAGFQNSGRFGRRVDTASLRDVYVVKSSFPSGLTTRHGRWSRATRTSVYDAQTGTLLQWSVSGTLVQSSHCRSR